MDIQESNNKYYGVVSPYEVAPLNYLHAASLRAEIALIANSSVIMSGTHSSFCGPC